MTIEDKDHPCIALKSMTLGLIHIQRIIETCTKRRRMGCPSNAITQLG